MKSLIKSFVINNYIDCKTLSIADTSVYNEDVPITDSIYRITLPNSNKYVDIVYAPRSVTHINSNNLRLSNTTDTDQLISIPSGIYTIRQSICPNDKLFFEYKYLNICVDYNNLISCLATLDCNDNRYEKYYHLKNRLLIAQDLVNICGDVEKGITLYNTTVNQINSLCC